MKKSFSSSSSEPAITTSVPSSSTRSAMPTRTLSPFVSLKITRSLEAIRLSAGKNNSPSALLTSRQISSEKPSSSQSLIARNIHLLSHSRIRLSAASSHMGLLLVEAMIFSLATVATKYLMLLHTFLVIFSTRVRQFLINVILQGLVAKISSYRSGRCFMWSKWIPSRPSRTSISLKLIKKEIFISQKLCGKKSKISESKSLRHFVMITEENLSYFYKRLFYWC